MAEPVYGNWAGVTVPSVRIADNRPAARPRGYLSGYDLDDEEKQGARYATDLPSTPGSGVVVPVGLVYGRRPEEL